jgi:hypothetical protein
MSFKSGRTKQEVLQEVVARVQSLTRMSISTRQALANNDGVALLALDIGTGEIMLATKALNDLGAWLCPGGSLRGFLLSSLLHPDDAAAFRTFAQQYACKPAAATLAAAAGETISLRLLTRPPGAPDWLLSYTRPLSFTVASAGREPSWGARRDGDDGAVMAALVVDLRPTALADSGADVGAHAAAARRLAASRGLNGTFALAWERNGSSSLDPFALDSMLCGWAHLVRRRLGRCGRCLRPAACAGVCALRAAAGAAGALPPPVPAGVGSAWGRFFRACSRARSG